MYPTNPYRSVGADCLMLADPFPSILAYSIDHAGSIEEGVYLVDQLLDVEHDFDAFVQIAAVGAGLGCPGNAG